MMSELVIIIIAFAIFIATWHILLPVGVIGMAALFAGFLHIGVPIVIVMYLGGHGKQVYY